MRRQGERERESSIVRRLKERERERERGGLARRWGWREGYCEKTGRGEGYLEETDMRRAVSREGEEGVPFKILR